MKQIYKVFLNDRVIQIGLVMKDSGVPVVNFNDESTEENVRNWFKLFLFSDLKEVYITHPQPVSFFSLFRSVFLNIDAAGGAVISDKYLLVIYRKGKWDLPKGKIDKGEKPEEAALREVTEEAGIHGQSIVSRLPSTYHIYLSPYPETKGEWIFKETYWFKMSYNGCLNSVRPLEEEGITEVKWVYGSEINEIMGNTYENLKQIIKLFA